MPVDPSFTPAAQFVRWLDTLPPQFCHRHRRTPLEVDRAGSLSYFERHDPLEEDRRRASYATRREPDVPHVPRYSVIARFRRPCPACKVRYACAPPEFDETTFDGFELRSPELAETLAKCREFAALVNDRGCGFLLMCGFTGSGKTRLACNIIREVRSGDCFYVRQGQLTFALRANYGRKEVILRREKAKEDEDKDDEDTPPTPLEIVQEVGFLVLDEIGSNPLANDERLFLDELLKHRYDQGKATVLISNLALTGTAERPGLKEFLDDALTDRIRAATGHGKFILQFSSDSYRRTGGADYFAGLA